MLHGIDISTHQGLPNFNKVKDQVDFIIIRASYGVGHQDTKFYRNKNRTRTLGIPRGYYHYAYPQHNEPEAEANYFASVVKDLQAGEFLVLDYEEEGGKVSPVEWCDRFLRTLQARFGGYKPLLYINFATAKKYDWKKVVKGDFGLWLALWDQKKNGLPPKTQWPVVAMRQYSATGSIEGIKGDVDMNVFYGDRRTLKKYGYKPKKKSPKLENVLPTIDKEVPYVVVPAESEAPTIPEEVTVAFPAPDFSKITISGEEKEIIEEFSVSLQKKVLIIFSNFIDRLPKTVRPLFYLTWGTLLLSLSLFIESGYWKELVKQENLPEIVLRVITFLTTGNYVVYFLAQLGDRIRKKAIEDFQETKSQA